MWKRRQSWKWSQSNQLVNWEWELIGTAFITNWIETGTPPFDLVSLIGREGSRLVSFFFFFLFSFVVVSSFFFSVSFFPPFFCFSNFLLSSQRRWIRCACYQTSAWLTRWELAWWKALLPSTDRRFHLIYECNRGKKTATGNPKSQLGEFGEKILLFHSSDSLCYFSDWLPSSPQPTKLASLKHFTPTRINFIPPRVLEVGKPNIKNVLLQA